MRSQERENVARLKANGYTCPNCGATRDADEFARAIKEVEDSIEKLKREFARRRKSRSPDNVSSSGSVFTLIGSG